MRPQKEGCASKRRTQTIGRSTLCDSVPPVLKILTSPTDATKTKAAPKSGSISKRKKLLRHNSRRGLRRRPRRSSGCRLIQNPVMNREQRQLQPVRDANLVINVAQIILDDLFGRPQLRGNFL